MARRSGRQRLAERVMARHRELLRLGTEDHYVDTALYDFEYEDRTEDIDWYTALAKDRLPAGSTLLELGAGTGRITLPLAQAGHHVLALDRMASMLDALQARLDDHTRAMIDVVTADMRTLPLDPNSVDMVIAPFNGLMHLYSWQDLQACFCEVARVLRPGGVFAFDVQMPDLDWLLWDAEERHAVTRFIHPTTGEALVYSTNHKYDAPTQVCHIRIYYDDAPPAGKKFRPPERPKRVVHLAHRQIYPEELRLHLASAGFDLESHTADFIDAPLENRSESQVVVSVRRNE